MFSADLHCLVVQEQRKDQLSAAKNQRLLHEFKGHSVVNPGAHSEILHWLGARLIAWGSKLQNYGSASIARNPAIKLPAFLRHIIVQMPCYSGLMGILKCDDMFYTV